MLRITRTRTAGALLAAALLTGGVAACSNSSSDEPKKADEAPKKAEAEPAKVSPAAAIKKAVEQNEEITSLSYSIKGTAPGEDGGTFDGEASMDVEAKTMHMMMSVDGSTERIEIRMVEGAMYMKAGAPVDGKSWLKFDTAALEAEGAPSGVQTEQNPLESSSFMTAAEDLEKVGEEKVEGVQTTHYTGVVTLAELLDSAGGGEDAKAREQALKAYQDLGIDELTMDMWIDKDNHTKQVRTKADTKEGPLDTTVLFGDINKPVTVEAPPASEVLDFAEMMGEQG